MRLTSLAATNLLSFTELAVDVPRGLAAVVGPNGAGKTNLARLVRLAVAGVRAAATGSFTDLDREWAGAGWYGSATFEARVGIVFDEDDERSLIEDWARVAVLTATRVRSLGQESLLDEFLPDTMGAGTFLGSGEVVIGRDQRQGGSWTVAWQTRDPVAYLDLRSRNALVAGPLPKDASQLPWAGGVIHEVLQTDDISSILTEETRYEQVVSDAFEKALGGFDLAKVLTASRPIELVAVPGGSEPAVPSMQRLIDQFPDMLDPSRARLTFAALLQHLLPRSLIVTDNRRAPARRVVGVVDLAGGPGIEDGSGVAVQLLALKNGDAGQRDRFAEVQGAFERVTGKRLDVRQQADATASNDPQMAVTPVLVDTHPDGGRHVDIPLHLAGAGVEEAALLALLLTDDRSTLVLDEPATNVSAVAQRRFLSVLRERRDGRQTVIITHSPHLVPVAEAADLDAVIRLDHRKGRTVTHLPRMEEVTDADLRVLLGQSQIRDLLFAAGVVLVEGATEVDAFGVWLATAGGDRLPTPESAHVVFLSVGGDTGFPKHARLMDRLGVPYAIVADGPAFRADGPLSRMPSSEVPEDVDQSEFYQIAHRWADRRVRTLATVFGHDGTKAGEIEAFFKQVDPEVWADVSNNGDGNGKPSQGYEFASRVSAPKPVLDLWRSLLGDLGLLASPNAATADGLDSRAGDDARVQ